MEESQLAALYQDHFHRPFPPGVYKTPELVNLDAGIMGCVSTFLAHKEQLGDWRVSLLQDGLMQLETVLLELTGEGYLYFLRLGLMAEAVLDLVRKDDLSNR